MPIRFFYEKVNFKIKNPRKNIEWIKLSAKKEKKIVSDINFIFCTDSYLLGINQNFLGHKTLTDIITFDNSEEKSISGEIYISIERVRENSLKFGSEFDKELKRVMIHGILHLLGYNDKLPSEVLEMRKKEDAYLSLHKRMFHVKQ